MTDMSQRPRRKTIKPLKLRDGTAAASDNSNLATMIQVGGVTDGEAVDGSTSVVDPVLVLPTGSGSDNVDVALSQPGADRCLSALIDGHDSAQLCDNSVAVQDNDEEVTPPSIGLATDRLYDCQLCHQVFHSIAGLNIHKGRMHPVNVTRETEEETETEAANNMAHLLKWGSMHGQADILNAV